MKKTITIMAVACLSLLIMPRTGNVSERELPKEFFITEARDIVFAKVLEQHCGPLEGSGIYTYVTLQVLERFKGDETQQELVLVLTGGMDGTYGITTRTPEGRPITLGLDHGGLQDSFTTGTEVIVYTHDWNGLLTTLAKPLDVSDGMIAKYNMTLPQFCELVKSVLATQGEISK